MKVRNTISSHNNHVIERLVSKQLVEKTLGKRVGVPMNIR